MAKNIVICLDGTNNQLKSASNTNVVRLFSMLDLKDKACQVGYYDPGVGTFSSPSAWTPVARKASQFAGLMFGAGLRQNLGEAYTYLMNNYELGDQIYVFGFSRGAYTARALTGMLDVFGVFRPGSENLVPYAVSAYAKQQKQTSTHDERERQRQREFFESLRVFATTHAIEREGHTDVHFVGVWDTVKAAGTIAHQLRWPFTRQMPHAHTIRHAVSIDEQRRPFIEYLVNHPSPTHIKVAKDQDLLEVWFAGVHSDVGGTFPQGTRLSDIPLKWMADQAAGAGLILRPRAYSDAVKQLEGVESAGPIHKNGTLWKLLGPGARTVPEGALIHASVEDRLAADSSYEERLPKQRTFVDAHWRSAVKLAAKAKPPMAVTAEAAGSAVPEQPEEPAAPQAGSGP